MAIYMDDVVLAGNDLLMFQEIKHILHNNFGIKDITKLEYFIGIEVEQSHKGIFIFQRKYCLDILTNTRMLRCKPTSNPMDYNIILQKEDGIPLTNVSDYRRLIAKLLYLIAIKPDITYSVQ